MPRRRTKTNPFPFRASSVPPVAERTSSAVHPVDEPSGAGPELHRGSQQPRSGARRVQPASAASLELERLGLEEGLQVIDLGCGRGDGVRAIAAAVGPSGMVYGVDRDADLIDEAATVSQRHGNARFEVGDARKLAQADGRFDRCHARHILQHAARPSAIVDEMWRVCARGGRVVITEWDWRTLVISDRDDVACAALRIGCARTLESPTIGATLFSRLMERGLVDVEVFPNVRMYRSLREAEPALELAAGQEQAMRAGRLSRPAAAAQRRRLEGLDAAGGFFASITGFTVVGTKR